MSETTFLDAPVWPAPAKLNLFLHITGRRSDGYHDLQTAFQFLDYGDKLRFNTRDDGQVHRVNELADVPEAQDLVVRAAKLLQAETGCHQGVDIQVEKILPLGGGLGGGSSDAATTLVALNQLWRLGLDENQLAALGLSLGADVPVFVRGRAAWAEGVGEHLEPVDPPEPWYVVLAPDVRVSTAELFGDPQLTRDAQPIKIRGFLEWLESQTGTGVDAWPFCNVFEPVVRAKYPEIDAALSWLGQHAPARLTGTGGCVFAAFDSEQQARKISAQAKGRWQNFVAAGCNRSPLFAEEVTKKVTKAEL
jgi:4-diphosphocytidyl-2-C-methyl-D-erythritol kinase